MTNTATAKVQVTLTVSRSSHPEFEFYASIRHGGDQRVCQGSREQVRTWVDKVTSSWAPHADRVELIRVDEFLPGDGL